MERVNSEMYHNNPARYTIVSGAIDGAPKCPFGNKQQWVGFDLEQKKYIRFTKSVFKKLIQEIENKCTIIKK